MLFCYDKEMPTVCANEIFGLSEIIDILKLKSTKNPQCEEIREICISKRKICAQTAIKNHSKSS